jgi:hypothetical protein
MAEFRSPGDIGLAIAEVWLSIDQGQGRSLCKVLTISPRHRIAASGSLFEDGNGGS